MRDLEADLAAARDALRRARRVAVLTGAGLSVASGLPTFRGADGLWRNYRAEDLATPEAYARDPALVWDWYAGRFHAARLAEPNAAHFALAALAGRVPDFTLVTQNVDGLHARAGSKGVLELHGNLTHGRCEACGARAPLPDDFVPPPSCLRCGARARPNVVWFGERLPPEALQGATLAFARAEVALVVGTSGLVEPAASLGRLAAREGAFVLEINPQPTGLSPVADLSLRADALAGLRSLGLLE